jgi:DNA polymerase elongation subunit (family B)
MSFNKLLYGKDETEGIISLDVKDNKVYLYKKDGSIQIDDMTYWVLTPKKYTKDSTLLYGDLHYKYIKKFDNKNDFYAFIRKINELDFFTVWNEKEAYLTYTGKTLFKNTKLDEISVLSFDIESQGLKKYGESKVYLITNAFRDSSGIVHKKHFRVDDYNDDDCLMIEDWCNWVAKVNPSIITGHNIYGYDLPYLQYCYSERDGYSRSLPLGIYNDPITFKNKPSSFRVDGNTEWEYHKIDIPGRQIIDGMFLAVRYYIGKAPGSWGLKNIIKYEGLEKTDRQHYDASNLSKDWYDLEKRELIVRYGIDDSEDSLKIFNLMIPPLFYMTRYAPKDLQTMGLSASGAQLNSILIRAYIQDNHSIPKADPPKYVGGGISFGIPGIHKNVLKIDVASMYPNIIRAHKLYPKNKDPKQYYLKMVDYLTEERLKNKRLYKETKEKYYDDMQSSQKIGINSSFGLAGTPGLNFNDFDLANTITRNGREIIKKTIVWATGKDIKHWFPEYDETKDVT